MITKRWLALGVGCVSWLFCPATSSGNDAKSSPLPADAAKLVAEARRLEDVSAYPEAVSAYERALLLAPNHVDLRSAYAASLLNSGRVREASEEYERVLSQVPGRVDVYVSLGQAYQMLGEYEAAERSVRQATRVAPGDAYPWIALGNVFLQQARYEAAIAALQKAVDLDPSNSEIRASLDGAVATQRMIEQGLTRSETPRQTSNRIGRLHSTVVEHPNDAHAQLDYGIALTDVGLWHPARAAFQSAVNLDPNLPQAHYHLGTSHLVLKEWEPAIYELRMAERLGYQDEHPVTLPAELGRALVGAERYDEAIALYEKYLNRDSDDYSYLHLARIEALIKAGRFQEAAEGMKVAEQLGLRPDSEMVGAVERGLGEPGK